MVKMKKAALGAMGIASLQPFLNTGEVGADVNHAEVSNQSRPENMEDETCCVCN